MKNIKRKIQLWLNKRSKRFLDIHIVEHCNLNCKSCAHFSPVAEQSCISIDELEKMYKNLQPIYNKFFNSLHLMGGEPLLHPKIAQIIELTRNYFPKTEIQIVTNGIKVLQMPELFWKVCSKNHVTFYISQYPLSIDYQKICEKLKKYRIKFIISKPIDSFICYLLDSKGKQNPSESYKKCEYAGYCIQLKDNKLFPCFQSAHINHINKHFGTNFMYQDGDYLSLDQPISKQMFKQFIFTPRPFCKYCNMNDQHQTTWETSKKAKEE